MFFKKLHVQKIMDFIFFFFLLLSLFKSDISYKTLSSLCAETTCSSVIPCVQSASTSRGEINSVSVLQLAHTLVSLCFLFCLLSTLRFHHGGTTELRQSNNSASMKRWPLVGSSLLVLFLLRFWEQQLCIHFICAAASETGRHTQTRTHASNWRKLGPCP